MKKGKNITRPGLFIASLPLLTVIGMLFCSLKFFKIDIHFALIMGAIVGTLIGCFYLNMSWADMEESIFQSILSAMQPILITGIIGFIIGAWILGGIVPSIVYYGLKFLPPNFFLVTVMIVCSIVSFATGSSWTTVGTVGLALIGVGVGMGFLAPIVAGAIISGAYFGDKMSPFSETTNLAPAIVGVSIFEHIKHMTYTTGTSYILSTIGFMMLNRGYSSATVESAEIDQMMTILDQTFVISPLLLLPLVLIIVMVFFKLPAIPGLMLNVLVGILCGIFVQGADITTVGSVLQYGFVSDTGNAVVDSLLTRGGLQSMMWTLSLILCALIFGGVMGAIGSLEIIAEHILKFVKGTGSLIFATIGSCMFMNIASGEQYLSLLVTGKMFQQEYYKRGLAPQNLSRALEDGGTLTSPLVPWCTCAVAMSAYLGVSTIEYLPYCLLNIINPIVAIVFGYLGISVVKRENA